MTQGFHHHDLENVSALLPQSVKDLADTVGYPLTTKLISHFGGATLSAKMGLAKDRSGGVYRLLQKVFSESECRLLMRYFGDTAFYIPRCDKAFRTLRNQRFLAEYDLLCQDGYSGRQAMAQLCPKYGFSDRIGWDLIAARTGQPSTVQPGLFG
ncbi:Mor transcription activator family protein [Morganella morganii]|uniref:Mor transcription activator family protein n=1 Tax=Morganella morganii TaxID=582 RepID=UPI000F5B4418|nr:Mor transcription activator family protein [Morganella morganii]